MFRRARRARSRESQNNNDDDALVGFSANDANRRAGPSAAPRQPHPPPRQPRQASAELVSIGTAAVISAAVRAVVRNVALLQTLPRRLSDGHSK